MPDFANLTDRQRIALSEFAGVLDDYRSAVRNSSEAQQRELKARHALSELIYMIAGAT